MSSIVLRQRRLHYAWIVAAVTFVVLAMAAGFRSVPGVFLLPLGEEFGWSHALVGGAVSVNLIVYGLGAPFAASAPRVARSPCFQCSPSGASSVCRLWHAPQLPAR